MSNWGVHRCSTQAAALAFYTIFSLAPILVVVIALAGAVFGEEAVRGQIVGEFQGLMGAEAARLVQEVLQSAARPTGGRLPALIGVVTLLFGATGVFGQLQDALNTVWAVAPKPGAAITTLLRKRLHSFALIVGIGFLLLVSLVLSAALTGFSRYLERTFDLPVDLLQVANFAVSFAVITLLFAMTYRILPDVRLAWRDVWLGSVLTALLFVVGKTLIGLYLGHTTVASAYGAAGSLVVVLVWVYYSSLIFFFGAELTRVHSRHFRPLRQPEDGAVRVPEGQAVAQP
ncbi:MAG: YihY/virulence factor BrkB family protein [Acidobacteriota bacterium]